MKYKYNGIETDENGSPVIGIPPIINGQIPLIEGDTLTMGEGFNFTSNFPVPNSFVAPKTGMYLIGKNSVTFLGAF